MRIMFAAAALGALGACAAPAPEDPSVETVLFGVDRESWGEEGLTALTRAGRLVTREGFGDVTVIGHADTQGDDDYNMALSARRADAVRRDLLARGVPPAVIETRALGRGALAVDTPPEVDEPANRRVEIVVTDPGALEPLPVDTPYAFPLP